MQNKKISFIIILLSVLAIASCRKRDTDPSTLHTVSYPIIYAFDTSYQNPNQIVYYQGIDLVDILNPGAVVYPAQIYYYSYPVGAGPALSVHAYDSATASVVPIDTLFNGHYNPNQAGLYIYQFNAKSTTGFGTLVEFVIAVTNYTGTPISDLNGFETILGTDTLKSPNANDSLVPSLSQIFEIANGLYINTNGAAQNIVTNTPNVNVPTFFVQIDSTHILFPQQPTNYNISQTSFPNIGIIAGSNGTVSFPGGIPVIQYTLLSDTLGLNNQVATFVGQ